MACDFHQSQCHQKIRSERQAAGCSNASINRALSALKQMFVLAVRGGKLQSAPHVALLKKPPAGRGFLELDAFRELRAELPDYLRAPVTLAFFTGVRLGEISRLTWQQVDLRDRTLNLNPGETKNDEARIIPLNRETVQDAAPRSGIRFRPPDSQWSYPVANIIVFSSLKSLHQHANLDSGFGCNPCGLSQLHAFCAFRLCDCREKFSVKFSANLWRVRLGVRTRGSQPCNTGSIPVPATKLPAAILCTGCTSRA